MYVCVYVHVCIYMPEGNHGCHFQGHLPLLLRQCLSLTGLDDLSPRDLPRLFPIFPAHCQTWHFMWILRIQFRYSCLQSKYFTEWVISSALPRLLISVIRWFLWVAHISWSPVELINVYDINFFSWDKILCSPDSNSWSSCPYLLSAKVADIYH